MSGVARINVTVADALRRDAARRSIARRYVLKAPSVALIYCSSPFTVNLEQVDFVDTVPLEQRVECVGAHIVEVDVTI